MKQLLCLSLIFVTTMYAYELSEQKIFRHIVSHHTYALDNKNMYARPLDKQALQAWDGALMQVKNFVYNNSKKQRKYLLACFGDIHKANTVLINRIEKVYTQCGGGSWDADIYKKFGEKFAAITLKMRLIEKSLDWVASKYSAENQAIQFVQMAARFVGVTARKAGLNLNTYG